MIQEKLLLFLKQFIESLSKNHQIEILRILVKNNCITSENQNGTFVNLNELDESTLNEMSQYLDYIKFQDESLKEIENKKEHLLNRYFDKQVKTDQNQVTENMNT
tara:strand:- start:640 stop:954 length:315 start_codon:yes stop_codon:yes gene_type:complete